MNVPVQFYAQLRDLTGISEIEVELPAGATVNELLEKIYQRTPALRAQDKSILVGAGVEFVNRDYVIKPGEAISIMPPVQGG
jgi:sulfur-carrier protein